MDREQLRALIERLVREEFARLRGGEAVPSAPSDRPPSPVRALITGDDVAAAAQGDKRLVVANAIITPLARDRAQELAVELIE